jgi:hypothetical protein
MIGDGVYTTVQPSKAVQYVKAVPSSSSNFSRGQGTGPLLVFRVTHGKVYDIVKDAAVASKAGIYVTRGSPASDWNRIVTELGYSTIHAPKGAIGLRNSETMTYDTKAVMPSYWLDIERKNR